MSRDVRAETGIETYVNDEPGDPNPGIIVDSYENRGRALSSSQARALAAELIGRADYFDTLRQAWQDALALAEKLDMVTPLDGLARTEAALTDENDCSIFHVVIAGGSDPVNVTMTPNMLRAALRAAAGQEV